MKRKFGIWVICRICNHSIRYKPYGGWSRADTDRAYNVSRGRGIRIQERVGFVDGDVREGVVEMWHIATATCSKCGELELTAADLAAAETSLREGGGPIDGQVIEIRVYPKTIQ